ncbi:Fn3-like domain-containing protein [Amniculibacterium sp. G2-70]|uniref:COG1470 family protein n=1 Tax=Amniculibacterium sp. G2-70 TaxID=2767188 RepID=UPI0016541E1B|nr:Fn3-like domain-containing protein [Amniculibacterium sp. G2-70]
MYLSFIQKLAAMAVLCIGVLAMAQGVTVSPTRLFFTGNPGEVQTQTVTIKNDTPSTVTFGVGLSDWYRDENGQKLYFAPNTLPQSNASWLKLSENSVTVAAGETKEVVVTMTVPAQNKNNSVTNSMLMFTQVARQDDHFSKEKSIGIKILFEFALHVFHTPASNSNEDLDFTAIDFVTKKDEKTGAEQRFVTAKIKNLGNVNSDSTVEFELMNKSTGAEIKLNPQAISMMPGAEQIATFPIPSQLKGAYKGVAIIRVGTEANVRVGEKEFNF